MNEIEFTYLDRKISSDSLEYAKENIWYHLLPYIVAQTDNELQGYKSIISLSLQSSILDELKTQQDKIQYKINALIGFLPIEKIDKKIENLINTFLTCIYMNINFMKLMEEMTLF